jgi:cytochrome c biogenesis protein CcdA
MHELSNSYLYGLAAVLHPCSLMMSFSALQLLLNLSLSQPHNRRLPFWFISGYAISLFSIGVISFSGIAQFTTLNNLLRDFSHLFIGPLLVLIGMFYTGLINWKFNSPWIKASTQSLQHSSKSALFLGIILGVCFCPATALLFFGAFLPYALNSDLQTLLIFPYTLGVITYLLIASLLIQRGSKWVEQHQQWSIKIGKISGTILILIGLYLSIQHLFI